MENYIEKYEYDQDRELLIKFNNKNPDAYNKVFSLTYKSFSFYAHSLYKDGPLDYRDAIQDAFIKIWENKNLEFDSLVKLKSYVFLLIKHSYLDYCKHRKVDIKHQEEKCKDDNAFIIQAVESEIYSLVSDVERYLPEECAMVIKLFLQGYDAKEVATMLNKPLSTVYANKTKSIDILRKHLPKNKIYLMLLFCIN